MSETQPSTFTRVLAVLLEETDVVPGDVTVETSLADDMDVDSLDRVGIACGLEEQFGIEIDDDDIEQLKTVGDIVAMVDRLKRG